MGGSSNATNLLNSAIENSVQIINRSSQQCFKPITNFINITTSQCQNFTAGDITNEQTVVLRTDCVQNVATSNDIATDVRNEFNQKAEAINQALNLNPGSTNATNITRLMQQLSTTLINEYSQTCFPRISGGINLTFDCINSEGSSVKLGNVTSRQLVDITGSCIQETLSTNAVKTEIENIIKQESRSVVEPIFTLGGIIIVLVLILLIIIAVFGATAQSFIIFIIIAAAIIGIYLLIAWSLGLWPFIE